MFYKKTDSENNILYTSKMDAFAICSFVETID